MKLVREKILQVTEDFEEKLNKSTSEKSLPKDDINTILEELRIKINTIIDDELNSDK